MQFPRPGFIIELDPEGLRARDDSPRGIGCTTFPFVQFPRPAFLIALEPEGDRARDDSPRRSKVGILACRMVRL